MARAEGTDNDAGAVNSAYANAPDTRLTELLRTRSVTAYPALQELRARHRASVLTYARLCTAGDTAARQLAAHAFNAAAREAARGTDPGTPVRHRLLLLVGEVAAQWASDERAAGLDAALLPALTAGAPVPPLLRAFRALPPRTQGLIWYGLIDQELEERTALLLGIGPADVTYDTPAALQALAKSALHTRLADSDDPDCQDFRRLIEESVRPGSPRHSPDLTTHMAHCPHCTTAYEEQCALRDSPRLAAAEGLLGWGGAAYAREVAAGASAPGGPGLTAGDDTGPGGGRHGGGDVTWSGRGGRSRGRGRAAGAAEGATATGVGVGVGVGVGHGAQGPAAGADGGDWAAWGRASAAAGRGLRGGAGAAGQVWPPARRLALASAALGVALVPLLVFLLSPGEPPTENAASQTMRTPPAPPPVTVTATVSVTPSPSPSPSRTRTSPPPSPSPSPTPTPTPSRTSARPTPSATPKPPPPPAHPPNGSFAPVVNTATGRCLDVRDDWFDNGMDVITAVCSGSPAQQWRYDAERRVLQSYADQEFCLDSRGSADRGVGIWNCDSVWGRNGVNLMFSVDGDGRIRPFVAPDTALTATGGDGVWLGWIDGDARQRWRAGRAA
ncbi:ricin-type beta-trefoil lectin domain protein [Streptomyces sp. NPDC053367]|uniref:ricin-type beta-trefoil lectin domain protein n=1 Tax=Streptomyces sp. NPDC053367 TaxID=3365700 RepID=UPI0037D69D85